MGAPSSSSSPPKMGPKDELQGLLRLNNLPFPFYFTGQIQENPPLFQCMIVVCDKSYTSEECSTKEEAENYAANIALLFLGFDAVSLPSDEQIIQDYKNLKLLCQDMLQIALANKENLETMLKIYDFEEIQKRCKKLFEEMEIHIENLKNNLNAVKREIDKYYF